MTPEQIVIGLAVVFVVAWIASRLDDRRIARRNARRDYTFNADHGRPRVGVSLARSTNPHISPPRVAPGKTLTDKRGRRR